MKDFLKILFSMSPLFVLALVPEIKESVAASVILIVLFIVLMCGYGVKDLFLGAVACVIDPDSRKLSRHKYPNGNGMSVREARNNGLAE